MFWLEVVDDIVEDIVNRDEAIAPLKKLQEVLLGDAQDVLHYCGILYLSHLDFPQEIQEDFLSEEHVGDGLIYLANNRYGLLSDEKRVYFIY